MSSHVAVPTLAYTIRHSAKHCYRCEKEHQHNPRCVKTGCCRCAACGCRAFVRRGGSR